MIKRFFLTVIYFLTILELNAQPTDSDRIMKLQDRVIVEQKLNEFARKSTMPISDLLVEIGISFLETPYVIASLENGAAEKMVFNLREFDCTTFAENCLALARTVKIGKTDFETSASELQMIRYRDGIRNGYLSRLHYFSEWILNNSRKGLIDYSPNLKGAKVDKIINYMSTHPQQYPVLKSNPELISFISEQEKMISKETLMYFPANDPQNLIENLKHGDIIGLTSSIEGVDINHVGIIVKNDDSYYLLHAPLSSKKVLISESPITDFIKPGSKNNGIMIARPIF
jgi:cell wall-associated NlpC family hydrolase